MWLVVKDFMRVCMCLNRSFINLADERKHYSESLDLCSVVKDAVLLRRQKYCSWFRWVIDMECCSPYCADEFITSNFLLFDKTGPFQQREYMCSLCILLKWTLKNHIHKNAPVVTTSEIETAIKRNHLAKGVYVFVMPRYPQTKYHCNEFWKKIQKKFRNWNISIRLN